MKENETDPPRYRFKILVAQFRKHERSQKRLESQGADCERLNDRCFKAHVEIDVKDGKTLELTGSAVRLGETEIELANIIEVHWITPDRDTLKKEMLKKDQFDCIYLQTKQGFLPIEGMGQTVFPVMNFLGWAMVYG